MKNLTFYSAKQSSKSNRTLYAVPFFYVKERTKTISPIACLEKKIWYSIRKLRLLWSSWDFRAFMFRLSCVHVQTFVRSCPDFRAFMFSFRAFMSRLSCVHVQTFVRSCPDFRAFIRLSCIHVQTFVRSCPDFRAFDRLSCVHVQTFVRFLMFPDYVILNARHPPRAFIFGLDLLASVWDLNLGWISKKWKKNCSSFKIQFKRFSHRLN